MNALAIIGITIGSAVVGGLGAAAFTRTSGDWWDFSPMYNGIVGAGVGGVVGLVGSSIAFTR